MSAVSRERWQFVSPHLDRAMEMTDGERGRWLAALRSQDPGLAADLEALLEERCSLDREGFLEGAVSLPPPASLTGQTIGAYTLVSSIGRGGMGSVWLARRSDGRFEGQAALKLLNASLIGRAGEERFRREGSILARLQHPHIARLSDAGVSAAGQPYLVLEHVDGEPIDRYCDAKGLDVEARLRVFLDVLAAVAHAHANLIVHRDIKPSNVLVGADGQVKLLDFGIAKLLGGETETGAETALTCEGGRALTPEYAAPEQVTAGTITTATDIHALGTLLYVLLTGRHPAERALQSPAQLVLAIVETEPQRLSDAVTDERAQTAQRLDQCAALRATSPKGLRRALKGDLETIVAKALKKRPKERYSSVSAMARDVKGYLDHEPIGARPDTLAYRAGKFARRHARGMAAAGAVVLLLALVVGFSAARLARERDRARHEAQKATKVSDLLTGLLTGADPSGEQQAREPTVRGILDAGAERIEKELAGQPELQAEMLTLMGRIYQRLGHYDKARSLLEKALAVGHHSSGAENERVAQSLNELGVLLRAKGDLASAAPVLEEALAMRRRVLGREHKDVAVTLVELGRVCGDLNNDERAEALFRESLAIRRKVLGEEDHETAVSLTDLAHVMRRRGDLSRAESLFRQSLPIFRKTRGEDHPHVATIVNNLGLIAADRGNFREAESLFREALAMRRRRLGDKHIDVASGLINLSRALLEQGRSEEAASVLREGLEIAQPAVGNDHPLIAFGKTYLARLHLARKEPAAAEPLARDSLRIRQRLYPPEDWRVAVPKSVLGAALTALGRYDEAEALLLDAQRVLKDIPGLQEQEARATRSRLVTLYEAWGRPEKAAPYRIAAVKG
jgi:eukaryotic-like serine/threonine-protein kinase